MPNSPEELNIKIGHIKPREITEEMKSSYIDYAMSVIISRALPDVRDGLKPVQRRILYSMHGMGLVHTAKFRKSAAVTGECFVKNTLILTEKGLIPIQKVKINEKVYTQSGLRNVIQLYEMPEKPLLKITLENGISNIATLSQKFKVLTPDWKFEWKDAKDLTKNDYLIVKADYPEINDLIKLNLIKSSEDGKKPQRKQISNGVNQIEENQPCYLNESIAYLLGLFTSDGWVTEDYCKKKYPRIGFTAGINKDIAVKVVSIFKQEFGYIPTIETKKYSFLSRQGKILNNEQYTIRINRKVINEFFVSNFNLKKKWALTKEIPWQIFNSPKSVIFSFISGLIEGDGSISLRSNVIHYGSISRKLINQLQILLQHQGIFSSKYTDKNLKKDHFVLGRIVKKKHEFYYLEIRSENAVKLASKINLAARVKNQRVCNLASKKITIRKGKSWSKHDIIPYGGEMLFQELSNNHLGAGWYQDITGNKFRMGIKYPNEGCKIRYSSDLLEKPLRKTQVIDWGIKNKLERIGSPLFGFLEHIIRNKVYFLKISSIQRSVPEKTYDFEVEGDHEFIANGMVSHNCLGKYHPHGDIAVYDALARMAQDFSLRYPLIRGQGNFGSVDGDSPAAQRYTEARLSKVGEEMLKDIGKDTIDFRDNYDGTRKEPVVLPSPLPQLLLNGSLGIAVGMATNIPPHNLSEVCQSLVYLIDQPKAASEDVFQFIKGPDFPGGGAIYGKKDIISAYSQGKGPIIVRGKAEVEEKEKSSQSQIIITEIPFQTQKSTLIEQLARLVQDKKIQGVKDIRDESDKEGMRIVLDCGRDAYPQKILNRLYKFTDLQKTFHLNMLALVDGIQPKVLSLVDVLNYFISHRKEVIVRRTKYDLEKAKESAHILEGLHKCLSKIDTVIKIIKASKNREEAQNNLMKKIRLTAIQANAILETKLAALAKLERKKIEDELLEMKAKIKKFTEILKSPKKIRDVLKKELEEVKENFGDVRRTKVYNQKIGEIAEEDLIPQEETIITLTQGGYIKRINPATYKIQKRGGKGILGMKTLQDDIVEHFLLAQTHDSLFFFTDSGKVFRTLAYEIPEGTRVARGRGILNFLEISPEEKVLSLLTINKEDIALGIKNLLMVTKNGIIKKTVLEGFKNVRRSGLIAIKLRKDDLLKKVAKSTGQNEIILVTQNGQSVRFREKEIRGMGRTASGVKGIRLKKRDKVIGMDIVNAKVKKQNEKLEKQYLLVVTENGYGKRTDLKEYRLQGRGGSGIKTAKITFKTGKIIFSAVLTGEEEDLIVISRKGQVIRAKISEIAVISRATQGVRIMKLDQEDKVASAMCI